METQIMGAAILGVEQYVPHKEIMLKDFARLAELADLKEDQFYPLSLYNGLVDHLWRKFNDEIVLENIGRSVGKSVIATALAQLPLQTVEEALGAIQQAHEAFCRPVEGEFKIIEARDRLVKLEYSAPYDCTLQEGLLIEVASHYGGEGAFVRHPQCRRHGANACIYEIVW